MLAPFERDPVSADSLDEHLLEVCGCVCQEERDNLAAVGILADRDDRRAPRAGVADLLDIVARHIRLHARDLDHLLAEGQRTISA